MSPTSLTALIFTIRDIYAIIAAVIFFILSVVGYFILYKLRVPRPICFAVAISCALAASFMMVDRFLGAKPLSLEIVRAG
jgi:hypothetical protein